MEKEYYEQLVYDITADLSMGRMSREETTKATRNLARAHYKLGNIEEAKTVIRENWNFNRKDLLITIANICQEEKSGAFAEELIGEVRCYAYTWLDFSVEMQQLYMDIGETDKAEVIAASIMETAFMSLRPATKAIYKSLEIQGKISDSYIIKNLYGEVKRIHKESNLA